MLLTAAVAIFLSVLAYLEVAVGIARMGLILTGPIATQFTGIIAVIMVLVIALNIYQSVTFAEPQPEH